MTRIRIALRTHRLELAAVTLFGALVAGIGGLIWLRLLAFGLSPTCFVAGPDPVPGCVGNQAAVDAYLSLSGGMLTDLVFVGVVVLPLVGGLILGTALVAKELDRGTTALAWAIAPSRRRWLLDRVVPVAMLLTAACLAAGLVADGLQGARDPLTDADRTFSLLGVRGVVVAAEGLAAFGIALAIGARLGRILPALLLAGAVALGAFIGTVALDDALLQGETIMVSSRTLEATDGQTAWAMGRVIDTRVRTPDGQVLTWREAYDTFGDTMDAAIPDTTSGFEDVYVINPGALYPIAEARMTVIFGAVGLMGIVLALAIVERRRPT